MAILPAIALLVSVIERCQTRRGEHNPLIDLQFSDEAIRSLRIQPRIDVTGRCTINGDLFKANVHLKGAATFEPVDRYPSYSAKLETPPGPGIPQKFYLNNSDQDLSYCRDIVARHFYRLLGVPVPSAQHALVTASPSNTLRPYVLATAVGAQFLRDEFPSCIGTLYEGETGGLRLRRPRNAAGPRNLPLPPPEWFLTSNCVQRLEAFLAAEYLVSNSDGYLTSANNFWVFRCDKHQDSFIFPHTADYTFRSSYWILCGKPVGNAAAEIIRSAPNRERIKATLRRHSSEATAREAAHLLKTKGTALLEELGPRHPATIPICNAIELLSRNIQEHLANVRMALQMDAGEKHFTDDYCTAKQWQDKSGQPAKPIDGAVHLTGPPSKLSERYVQCYVMLRPGSYRWLQPLPAEFAGLGSIKLEVIGRGITAEQPVLISAGPQHHVFAVTFSANSAPGERLFDFELARLRVAAVSSNVNTYIPVNYGQLEKLNP